MKVLGAVVVAVLAILAVLVSVLKHPVYTPDGIVYARFAARDAGYSERDATLAARAFYDHTAMMSNPRYRALIELDPAVSFARSRVFDNRVLYPWIVGLALRAAGFRALFLVNAAAYAAFALALYWMLLAFRQPVLGALLTIAAVALPLTRASASSDLTDMTAMVWWALALGALLRLIRVREPWLLAVLAIASVLLTLTRPTPYLVLLPALAIGLVRGAWTPLLASLGGAAAFAGVAVSAHAYGISEQLHWVYSHRPSGKAAGFRSWYTSALASTLRYVAAETVRTVFPLLMIAVSVYGMWRSRTRPEMAVLVFAAIACLVAVPFNPVPSSLSRVVLLPLVPVFCGMTLCVAAGLIQSKVLRPAEQSTTTSAA